MKSNSASLYIMYLKKDTNSKYECLLEDCDNKIRDIEELSIVDTSLISPKDKNKPSLDDGSWCVLWLYFHNEDDFNKTKLGSTDYPFGQYLLVQGNGINFETKDEKRRYPILHIANVNSAGRGVDQSDFLRYYNIMNSSIWNYLVCDLEEKENNELCFDKAVKSIYDNYQKGLYDLLISLEYADLNARICKDSYLVNLGDGHSDGVSPFIFHSEHFVKRQLIKKEFEEARPTLHQIVNRKWRILLVDDRALIGMAKNREPNIRSGFPDIPWNCKLNIIIRLIKNQFKDYPQMRIEYRAYCDENKPIPKDTTILVEYATTLKDAHEALKEKKYDVILLDYLLRPAQDGAPNMYGYELLELIYKQIILKEQVRDFLDKNDELETSLFDVILNKSKYEEILKLLYLLCINNCFINGCFDKELRDKTVEDIYVKLCSFDDSNNIENFDDIKNKVLECKEAIESLSKNERETIIKEIIKTLQAFKDNFGFIEKENAKIGSMNRFFFMFISAYSSAVHDRLFAEGLNQSEKFWFINLGACPTNTPQLFLYNLIKLMEKRLEDSGILKLSSEEIYDLVNKTYLPKEQDSRGDSVRKRANALYQKVLSLQYHYRNILKDVEIPFGQNSSIFDTKGSVLMTDFIQKKINLGGMLEHLTQLVHLTAFGTVRQWPEMWEEYIYFKAQFEKQVKEDNEAKHINCKTLFSNIEQYILDLKSQQQ